VAVDNRAEFVVVRNDGGAAVNLRRRTLVSEKGNQAWPVVGEFVLQPGARVAIHASRGQAATANLYSGSGKNIWNNTTFYDDELRRDCPELYPIVVDKTLKWCYC
jgi:hypothetical protein